MSESIGNRLQTADWKTEKHVTVIDCPDKVKVDQWVDVKVTIGKEIPHPNTTEHHIKWVRAFFAPDGDKFAHDLGNFEFNSHGEGLEGPNKGPAYTHSQVSFSFKANKTGTLNVVSYCNIHGLWESTKKITIT
jgi:superoxide reductase